MNQLKSLRKSILIVWYSAGLTMGWRRYTAQPCSQSRCTTTRIGIAIYACLWKDTWATNTGAMDKDHVRTNSGHHWHHRLVLITDLSVTQNFLFRKHISHLYLYSSECILSLNPAPATSEEIPHMDSPRYTVPFIYF